MRRALLVLSLLAIPVLISVGQSVSHQEERIKKLKAEAMFLKPELIKEAWDYYKNEQTKDIQYTPLVGEKDVPAVYLNKDIMTRFKPQLQKYYYNPEKYKTYLDQLGIAYPTLRDDQRKAVAEMKK